MPFTPRFDWTNKPSHTTPIKAEDLLRYENGIAAAVEKPAGGTDGQALIKSGSAVVWGTVAGGGGAATLTDNGDGTFLVTGSGVVDNGNGTYTITA